MQEPAAKPTAIPRSGKRARTKLRNRETILSAAHTVFADIGFGTATVRDIIRATPLASGTFYNYFKSKEEVYRAIRDNVALAIRPLLRAERSQAATREAFISGTFRSFFEYAAGEHIDFRNLRHKSERFGLGASEMVAGFADLREDLENAIGRGLFPPVDADFLLAAIVGVGFEVAERMMARMPPDPAAAAGFATALFLGGVDALPASEGAAL